MIRTSNILNNDFKPATIKHSPSPHWSQSLLTFSNQLIHKTSSSNKYNEHAPIFRPIDSMNFPPARWEHLVAHHTFSQHSELDRCLYTCHSFTGPPRPTAMDSWWICGNVLGPSRWESLSAQIKPWLFLTNSLNSNQVVHYSQSVSARHPSREKVSVKLDKITQHECGVNIQVNTRVKWVTVHPKSSWCTVDSKQSNLIDSLHPKSFTCCLIL